MIPVLACYFGIIGALLMAVNIPQSPWAYVLFLISSLLWLEYGAHKRERSLVIMNGVFACINIIGIARWLVN